MAKQEPPPAKQEPKRKKRRDVGTYACSSCPKVFTRSDHLARHYLNHQPKEVYVCEYVITSHKGMTRTCGKTFVRKDLRERHYKRHLIDKPGDSHERQDDINVDGVESQGAGSSAQSTPLHAGDGLHYPGTGSENRPGEHMGDAPIVKTEPHFDPRTSSFLTQSHINLQNHFQANSPSHHSQDQMGPGHQAPVHLLSQPQIPHSLHSSPQSRSVGLSANQNIAPAHSRPYAFPPPGPNSPLSQMYPQPFQMHHNPPNPHFNGSATIPLHSQEPPNIQRPAYGPEETPIDPNTVNPHDIMRNYMPQPANDILSWLFLDSPDSSRSEQHHLQNPSSTPASMTSDFPGNCVASPVANPYPNARNPNIPDRSDNNIPHNYVDPMLNIGLQDLNYFANSNNPLEEAFNPSPVKQSLKHMGVQSAASSSPSNTNESSTPQSVSDKSTHEWFKPSIKDRLRHHFHRINLEHFSHFYVNESMLKTWLESMPEISRDSLESIFNTDLPDEESSSIVNRLSYYLHAYWEVFHPKFLILHRPSFNTAKAEPLLIFAMLCVGAMYCTSSVDSQELKSSAEFKFCMLVATPLRFKLFQHQDFKSPIKVWILQTLNLLDWNEKNYLSRHMHERAYIHHGTTVQLLRRSPFLGGNPESTQKPRTSNGDSGVSGSEEENSDPGVSMDIGSNETVDNDATLFDNWVESESMKRVTFMTFYLDITDYIKFRHNPQIPFFQLQFLNLPCDDEKLWDCYEVNGSFKKLLKRQKSLQKPSSLGSGSRSTESVRAGMNFLNALKRIIKPSRVNQSCRKLSMFTKAILFGGIASVMHQVQQAELQNSFTFLLSHPRAKNNNYWKEFIVKALDNCEVQNDSISSINSSSDRSFAMQKGQCRFPMYHLIHIIGLSDVNHYDIAIYGGSSQNMSVKATSKDYNTVKRKLTTIWQISNKQISDMANYRSVIHCYWLLWSLMLKPMDANESATVGNSKYVWSIDEDYYDTMYPISVSMLVLWCYTFTVCGAESSVYQEKDMDFQSAAKMDSEQLNSLVAERGYEYLYRIREEFKTHIQNDSLTLDYLLHVEKGIGRQVPPHEAVSAYCGVLPRITLKENISGLCFLVGAELLKSQWEIVRENAKLIINCGLRSLGKTSIHCPDLFCDCN